MTRPVDYLLDRKYIGFAVKLFHRASRKGAKEAKSKFETRNPKFETKRENSKY